jgi:hypothetical protein
MNALNKFYDSLPEKEQSILAEVLAGFATAAIIAIVILVCSII